MPNHGYCKKCWWHKGGICYMQGVRTQDDSYCPDYANRDKLNKKRCLDLCGVKELDAYTVNVEFPSGMDGFTERMYFVCRQLTDRILTADGVTLEFVLSQTMSYIVEHCRRKGIDLDFFIRTKMKYNRLRGYKHGGKNY